MKSVSPTPPPLARRSWPRWLSASEEETRVFVGDLGRRLDLTPAQRPLWDHFSDWLARCAAAAAMPDPGDGWDQRQSAAHDELLRLEIAAGRLLGAVEETRACCNRLYACLSPMQCRLVDAAISSRQEAS